MSTCLNCEVEITNRRRDAKYCSKVCMNRAGNKRYYKRHPEKITRQRRYYLTQVEKRILTRIKHKAKKFGIDFNLTVEDIIVPKKCPVLGIKLVTDNRGNGYHANSPSVDRINPYQGYVKGNVRIISARANLLKNDASSWELRKVLEDLERIELESSCD